jgi:hypothetical protein
MSGGGGKDKFVIQVGEGDGDVIANFNGAGKNAGDTIQFVGYGPGAILAQTDETRWTVFFDGFSESETIRSYARSRRQA